VVAVCIVQVSMRSYPDGPTTVRDSHLSPQKTGENGRNWLQTWAKCRKWGEKREKPRKTFGGTSEMCVAEASQKLVVGSGIKRPVERVEALKIGHVL
jgi:hypothetical protein